MSHYYLKIYNIFAKLPYSSRARVGHPPLEGHPLVVGSISVGIGTQENPPDVCHVVHTHCWAFKYVTVEGEKKK